MTSSDDVHADARLSYHLHKRADGWQPRMWKLRTESGRRSFIRIRPRRPGTMPGFCCLSDEDAYMQLVLCNTQSELHPLEEGKHASESGMDLKAYAEASGKVYQTLVKKLWAWRVLAVIHVDNVDEQALFNEWRKNQVDNPHGVGEFEDYLKEFYSDRAKRLDIARDSWRNLAEIHAAPKWLWSALVYFCRKDKECVRLLEANRGELGSHGGVREQDGNRTLPSSRGTTSDYTKLRLKRDRPDLYERVINGDLTANAAAIEAGFRKPPKPRPTTPRFLARLTHSSITHLMASEATSEPCLAIVERITTGP